MLNSYYVSDTLLDLKIIGLKRVVKIPAHLSWDYDYSDIYYSDDLRINQELH